MKDRVEAVLKEIQAILQADGGKIDLISVSEGGIVQVRLTGGCGTCESAIIPLKKGIERMFTEQIPEVKEVIVV